MDYDLDDDFEFGETDEDDPLDAEDFKPVEYINRHFPNEVSLTGLDGFVGRLKSQQHNLDSDIRHAIRRQSLGGRRARSDLDDAKAAIKELFERIKAIKTKAEQSEVLVSDVCRDIKSLDVAKRNVTATVTALKRLVMLVTALQQLKDLAGQRMYREASGLIHAVEELAAHFQELSHIQRVSDLLARKSSVLGELKAQLLRDYASLVSSPHDRAEGIETASCCVDAMGPSMRREVIQQFCLGLLEEYMEIFQPPKEASELHSAERRFSWLKRKLNEYEEKYKHHFPESWRVRCGLCEQFCHITRQHLVEVLGMSAHTIDPELMVRILMKSIDFENDLAKKYPAEDFMDQSDFNSSDYSGSPFGFKYPEVLGKPAAKAEGSRSKVDELFVPRFKGTISVCFEQYLVSWVRHEEKCVFEILDRLTAPGADSVVGQDDPDEDDAAMALFASAPELFSAMKQSTTKCSAFNTHETFFDVFQVCRKVFSRYARHLGEQLPRNDRALENAEVQTVCCVIGTAEYCEETLGEFSESLVRIVDPSFEDRLCFSPEKAALDETVAKAMETLVTSVSRSLDPIFAKMTGTMWAQFNQEAEDQSAFVTEISDKLTRQYVPVAKHLTRSHYKFFCDKFMQRFVKRFRDELVRCRKISEAGAQQLLLDASFIKTTLLEVPVTASQSTAMSTAYSNFVLREMGRVEAMLKVLSAPEMTPEAAAELLGGDTSQEDAAAVLALRASSTVEPPALPAQEEDQAQGFDAGFGLGSKIGKITGAMTSLGGAMPGQDLKKVSERVKTGFGGFGFSSMGAAKRPG